MNICGFASFAVAVRRYAVLLFTCQNARYDHGRRVLINMILIESLVGLIRSLRPEARTGSR